MSDTPILQPGDIIHMTSGPAAENLIIDISETYERQGIRVEWSEWFGAGSPRIISIIRGKTPMDLMAAMSPPSPRR